MELRLSAGELLAIIQELRHDIPLKLYPNVWRQLTAEAERIEEAPLLAPNPIHLPADDPEQFLDWLRTRSFRAIADRVAPQG